jgi:hypothetical protein
MLCAKFFTAVLLMSVALSAQTPCNTQVLPIKPPAMFSCRTATPVCVSDGSRAHWEWMCPAGRTPGNGSDLDPSIPLSVKPPQIDNSIDIAIQAEKLRQLRLQNQITQEQLDATQKQDEPAVPTIPPPPFVRPAPPTVDSTLESWKTKGDWNGRFWRSFDEEGKGAFLFGYTQAANHVLEMSAGSFEKYQDSLPLFLPPGLTVQEILTSLDTFYETPENRQIAIIGAISVVSQRARGLSEETVQKYINKLRAAASR